MSDTLATARQAKLIKVSASKNSKTGKTNNNNKFYNMIELGDGTFKVEFGRVEGGKPQVKIYPMSKWDATLKKKLKGRNGEPPYKDVSHLVLAELAADTSDDDIADVEDKIVAKIIADLQSYATGFVQKTYSVSAASVTQAMIDEAQSTLNWLVSNTEVGARKSRLNDKLQELFMIIPRRMGKVEDHLFPTLNQANIKKCLEMLSNEQDTLDTMAGQVSLNESKKVPIIRNT